MAILLASILDADWANLENEIKAVDSAGVQGFSIDIMDGMFVPRITFGPHIVSKIRNLTDLPIEVHMMVSNPEKQVEKFCDAGADQVVFHIEATNDAPSLINYVKSRGLRVGLAMLLETNVESLSDEMIKSIDVINLMAVPVGYGGQKKSTETIERVRILRERAEKVNPSLAIEIDGGMKPENCSEFVDVGADVIIIGTGIYKSSNYSDAIDIAKSNIASDNAYSLNRLKGFLECPSNKLINDIDKRNRLKK